MARQPADGAGGLVPGRGKGRLGATGRTGVQLRARRRDGWTAERVARFLAVLEATCNVSEACRAVGIGARAAYSLRQRDATFAADWQAALARGYEELEMLLLRQSLFGLERTETVRDGAEGDVKATKTVHSYSPQMALRLLLAHRDTVGRHHEAAGTERPDSDAVIERVRAELARVRTRMAAGEE
jgi:hypothetical protein